MELLDKTSFMDWKIKIIFDLLIILKCSRTFNLNLSPIRSLMCQIEGRVFTYFLKQQFEENQAPLMMFVEWLFIHFLKNWILRTYFVPRLLLGTKDAWFYPIEADGLWAR
jgi:hypothetical protein